MSTTITTPTAWIFRGNIVVPTKNPFVAEQEPSAASNKKYEEWLGPGLKLLLDHELHASDVGMITYLGAPVLSSSSASVVANASSSSAATTAAGRATIVQLKNTEFLCPGMIDLHIHAPQFIFTGTATDKPLMGPNGWLESYTFPTERNMKNDLDLCRRVMKQCTETTLANGTTTCVYFATLHLEPCQILVDACIESGQRALVGKPCMDRKAPDNYCQSIEANLHETTALIEYIYKVSGRRKCNMSPTSPLPRILPLVAPRFIPTCSPALLNALGDIAKEHDCHITSHLSESYDEVAFSKQLDIDDHGGGGRTDAAIFDEAGLLTDQCIMAHATHLTSDDMDLLKRRGTGVAPCPHSNFFFAGGHAPCRKMLSQRLKVGLGTDVAGGPPPSMLNAQRIAVLASHSLQHAVLANHSKNNCTLDASLSPSTADAAVAEENHVIDYRHAFYLATLGGAEALGLDDRIGTFKVGMEFDAFVLSAYNESPPAGCSSCCCNPNIHIFERDTISDILQKLLVLGDDRNVTRVFVQGQEVIADLKKKQSTSTPRRC